MADLTRWKFCGALPPHIMRIQAEAQVCVGEWTILRKCANTGS